jgi:hypothetical protein
MQNGKITYLDEGQVTVILEHMKLPVTSGTAKNLQSEIVGIDTAYSRGLRIKMLLEAFDRELEAENKSLAAEVSSLKADNSALKVKVATLEVNNAALLKHSSSFEAYQQFRWALARFNGFVGYGKRKGISLSRWLKILAIPGFGLKQLKDVLFFNCFFDFDILPSKQALDSGAVVYSGGLLW